MLAVGLAPVEGPSGLSALRVGGAAQLWATAEYQNTRHEKCLHITEPPLRTLTEDSEFNFQKRKAGIH